MQASFTIRRAVVSDRPLCIQFMAALQDTERDLHPNRPPGTEVAVGHFAYLEERVREQNGAIYVAESENSIVGFVICFVEKLDDGDLHVVESARVYGYISDLYITSTMRKQGVGAALMTAAEQHFLGLGLSVVRVGLLCRNQVAAQFYERSGYQPYEVVYEKILGES